MKVAFIGHRQIDYTENLDKKLTETIEKLVILGGADLFYFGSRGKFNSLCYKIITQLKTRYPHLKRVFVRAEFENAGKNYTDYLLNEFEETFFPAEVHGAGALSYVKRNQVIIDMCDVLVTYFDCSYSPKSGTKSGTKLAVEYANKKNKRLINVF